MRARHAPAREEIISALPAMSGRSLLSVADIAYGAKVAQSTVRRHLDSLIRDGWLQHTSYVGIYGLGQRARAAER